MRSRSAQISVTWCSPVRRMRRGRRRAARRPGDRRTCVAGHAANATRPRHAVRTPARAPERRRKPRAPSEQEDDGRDDEHAPSAAARRRPAGSRDERRDAPASSDVCERKPREVLAERELARPPSATRTSAEASSTPRGAAAEEADGRARHRRAGCSSSASGKAAHGAAAARRRSALRRCAAGRAARTARAASARAPARGRARARPARRSTPRLRLRRPIRLSGWLTGSRRRA